MSPLQANPTKTDPIPFLPGKGADIGNNRVALRFQVYHIFISWLKNRLCSCYKRQNDRMANQLKEFLESNKNLNQTEQIVSSGVGSALIALGIQNLKKSPVLACTSIATGAYFLFRSATAYCMVKDVLQKENWLNEEYEPEDFY